MRDPSIFHMPMELSWPLSASLIKQETADLRSHNCWLVALERFLSSPESNAPKTALKSRLMWEHAVAKCRFSEKTSVVSIIFLEVSPADQVLFVPRVMGHPPFIPLCLTNSHLVHCYDSLAA